MDLLKPLVDDADDDDFKHFFEHYIGSDHLEQMLYPSGGEPVLKPNESDENYFNAIFAKEEMLLKQHLEDIETTEGSGKVISDEKLLRQELGYPPHKVDDLSLVAASQNFVQKHSNRLLREAYTFYREQVGDLISQQRVLGEKKELAVNILEATSEHIRLQAGATSNTHDQLNFVPVGDAHVYYQPNGNDTSGETMSEVSYNGRTDGLGTFDINLDTAPKDGGEIYITSGYQTKSIRFDDVSDLQPEPISIVSHTDNKLIVGARNDDGKPQKTTIEINGTTHETDEDGTAVFDLNTIDPQVLDDNGEEFEGYQIELEDGSNRSIKADSLAESEYSPITYGDYENPVEKARILINLVFVLLHSLRIVYAEFGIPNKQYKIDIFQSLNDRGEELNIRDIIRARVIAKEVNNVEAWRAIDDRFDGEPEDIENFLKQYITAEQGITKPDNNDVKSLFALHPATVGDAESILKGTVSEAEQKLDKLETYSRRYEEISEATLPAATEGEIQGFTRNHASANQPPSQEEQKLRQECEARFGYLNEVGKVWEPFVLSLYYEFTQTDGRGEKFNKILEVLVKIIYRYTPYGEGISSSIARTYLHDMAKTVVDEQLDVNDKDKIVQLLKSELPEDLELEEVARRFATRRNWQSDTVKSLYARHIDIKLSQQSVDGQFIEQQFERTEEGNLTIEHIFPSSLGLNGNYDRPKRWLEVYFEHVDSDSLETLINDIDIDGSSQGDDVEMLRRKFVNDIGNMMPLIRAENASVSDRLFSKKLTYYFLVGMFEMKSTDEYLYEEHSIGDIVPLIEKFVEKAGYNDDVAASIFGLLVESGDSAQQDTISEALDEYEIDSDQITSTNLDTELDSESTVKDKIRSMLKTDIVDETKDTVERIVKTYNKEWTVDEAKIRKEDLIREMLVTLAFEDEYDSSDDDAENFGAELETLIDEDYEKRIDLR